jgi:GDP-L-fucose synthase
MSSESTVVFGGRGLVGSALIRAAEAVGEQVLAPSSAALDLRDRAAVVDFFEQHRPRRVYLAAAIVGGILENSRNPVPFVNDNVLMQTHVMEAAFRTGVERLMLLGSSCIYPRACTQPMCETDLMTGPLEPTNSAYAMAKLVGLEQVSAYKRQHGTRWLYVIPPNVYGPRDHFYSDKSHVISALITRVHEAKLANSPEVGVWGTGSARREFIYVEDLARMLIQLMAMPDVPTPINTGTGSDVSIRELAETIVEVVGYRGRLAWDATKPDGMPRKLMNSSRVISMGVASQVGLREGLELTYRWFLENQDVHRKCDARANP